MKLVAGATACVIARAFDRRFGFEVGGGLVYPGGPADHFQAQAYSGRVPRAEVAYHGAFGSG